MESLILIAVLCQQPQPSWTQTRSSTQQLVSQGDQKSWSSVRGAQPSASVTHNTQPILSKTNGSKVTPIQRPSPTQSFPQYKPVTRQFDPTCLPGKK